LADIFVSYSNEDRERVRGLIEALMAAGWTVWYDNNLTGGSVFSEEIENEITNAKIVVAVWSDASLKSRWVMDEAEMGRELGKLVPITLDGCTPPIGFRQYQAIDFSNWNGEPSHGSFKNLLTSFAKHGTVDPPLEDAMAPTNPAGSDNALNQNVILGIVGLIVLATIVTLLLWKPESPDEVAVVTADNSEIQTGSLSADEQSVGDEEIPIPGFGGRGAVAVLPFTNMSADGSNAHIADGIAEDILTSLQAWGIFPVSSRNSTFVYKGQAVDIPTVAATLGVRYVLEGSVQRSGDQIRVTAQLIDAETDSHLWAKKYDRQMVDVFAIQDEISEQIVTSIVPEITRSESRRVANLHPADLTTWEMTLKAQGLTLKGQYGSSIAAKKMLEDVLLREPDYALAHVRLAEVCRDLGEYFWQYQTVEGSEQYHKEGLLHARRAAELAPNLVEARIWLGHLLLHARKVDQGVVELREGVRLNPSHGQMRAEYGFGLALAGETARAQDELSLAMKLSPNDPRKDRISIFQSLAYLYAGDYENASSSARRIIDTRPGSQLMIFAYIVDICSNVRLGRIERANTIASEFRANFDLVNWTMISRGAWTEEELAQVGKDLRSVGVVAD